jgi:AcrR family transcriptional regulator
VPKTVIQKAGEWGVSPRYVQYLCRKGKIYGIEKKAGAWFIPDNVPNPKKKLKSDEEAFKYTGTKERIFYNAIKLFMQKGFECVSIKDIAKTSDIQQSAVYNHFKSKQSILNSAYGFFRYYANKNRLSKEKLECLLKNDSLIDIVTNGFLCEYSPDVLEQMLNISKIIVQRMTIDIKANELFSEHLMEDGIEFVEEGLKKAIEIGRLAPHDSYIVSLLIHCIRKYVFMWWVLCPSAERRNQSLEDEQNMYKFVISMLTDLKPQKQEISPDKP